MRYVWFGAWLLSPVLIAAEPVVIHTDNPPDAVDLQIGQREGPKTVAVENNGVPVPQTSRERSGPVPIRQDGASVPQVAPREAAPPVHAENDGAPVLQIGQRPGAPAADPSNNSTVTIGKRERLKSSLPADAYQKEAAKIARELGAAAPSGEAKTDAAIVEDIQREPDRAGAAFAALLNPKHAPDAAMRKGAALGIAHSNASTKVVGAALANAALSETDKDARAAVISAIQQRKDAMALHGLMTKLQESMDPDGLGIVNEPQRNQALAALRDIGDRRIYHALLYYVTLEIRAGTASLVALNQTFITNSGDVNNGAVGQSSINLPIDLPTLELNSVQGTIVVPAICQPQFALRKVTGQDFGKDLAKWREWIDKQPEMRK